MMFDNSCEKSLGKMYIIHVGEHTKEENRLEFSYITFETVRINVGLGIDSYSTCNIKSIFHIQINIVMVHRWFDKVKIFD